MGTNSELLQAMSEISKRSYYLMDVGDYGVFKVVAVEDHGSGRWSSHMSTIIELPSGRLYSIDWENGLTEYQENEYPWDSTGRWYHEPVEVEKVEEVKIITRYKKKDTSHV